MYTTEERREQVRGLQRDLRLLGLNGHISPVVSLSGVYDTVTTRAVRDFQGKHSLPPTGRTDLDTWNAIVLESNQVRIETGEPLFVRIFPAADFVLRPGDSGRLVVIVQALLSGIAPHFGFPLLELSGQYDAPTVQVVSCLQRAAGLPITGVFDNRTWNYLAGLYSNYGNRSPLTWLLE